MAVPKKAKTPTLRVRRDGFRAEITRSSSGLGNIYHYIVQSDDSSEILCWGQERSLKEARIYVNEFIDRKLQRSRTGS